MLDYRLETFSLVCNHLNYHKVADILGITQPAVTQQIRFLEKKYDCKLFLYRSHKLIKTDAAVKLEQYVRAMRLEEQQLKESLQPETCHELRIGASKSVGDYFLPPYIHRFLERNEHFLNLVVDNTTNLLQLLNKNELDFAIVEGYFDKSNFNSLLLRREPFVGICPKNHPFAGREISVDELLKETFIHREAGSGTRAILETELNVFNESIHRFKRCICISSFPLILDMVKRGHGISFVYKILADSDPDLETFRLKNSNVVREFNIVYLKHTDMSDHIQYFFDKEDLFTCL